MVSLALPLIEKLLFCAKSATAFEVISKKATGPAAPPACQPIEIEPSV